MSSQYKAGDRVEVKVNAVVSKATGSFVEAYAAGGDTSVALFVDNPAVTIRKLPPPKPKAGEVIGNQQLLDIQWKRGTTLRYASRDGLTCIAVLHADGVWHSVDSDGHTWGWEFDVLEDHCPEFEFELLHVA